MVVDCVQLGQQAASASLIPKPARLTGDPFSRERIISRLRPASLPRTLMIHLLSSRSTTVGESRRVALLCTERALELPKNHRAYPAILSKDRFHAVSPEKCRGLWDMTRYGIS